MSVRLSERRFPAQKCTIEILINPDTAEVKQLSGTQSDVWYTPLIFTLMYVLTMVPSTKIILTIHYLKQPIKITLDVINIWSHTPDVNYDVMQCNICSSKADTTEVCTLKQYYILYEINPSHVQRDMPSRKDRLWKTSRFNTRTRHCIRELQGPVYACMYVPTYTRITERYSKHLRDTSISTCNNS